MFNKQVFSCSVAFRDSSQGLPHNHIATKEHSLRISSKQSTCFAYCLGLEAMVANKRSLPVTNVLLLPCYSRRKFFFLSDLCSEWSIHFSVRYGDELCKKLRWQIRVLMKSVCNHRMNGQVPRYIYLFSWTK